MSASATPTSLAAATVLTGVPVVPGVRFAPVIRPGRLPAIEDLDPGGEIAEADREAEAARFTAAAATVAGRLRERAAASTGSASEVLAATAIMLAEEGRRKRLTEAIRHRRTRGK